MLKKCVLPLLLTGLMLLGGTIALADDNDPEADYPWQYHAPPFDFSFGNMINSHQQSRLDSNSGLHGFIYIHDTGDFTEEGLPIAEKAHCPTQDCRVGWVVRGVAITATLVNKGPRIWLVDPNDLPVEPGYSHFHWTGAPHSPHELVIGQEYSGYLMKRMAPAPFLWLGGSGSGGGGHSGSGGSGGCSGEEGGCSGEEGGCSGEEGGCSGEEGGCSGGGGDMGGGDMGGGSCSGEEGGCSGEEGGCSGEDSSCSGEEGDCSGGGGDMGGGDMGGGSCSGEEGGCSGEEGGCSGEEGGCSGEEGGCSGGGGSGGGGHGGRLVTEGLDSHTNIVTEWDGSWGGGGSCGGCSDGCGED